MNAIEIALGHHLERFEQDRSLHEVSHLRQRIEALDVLDVLLLDEQSIGAALLHRARTVCAQLESSISKLYERIRVAEEPWLRGRWRVRNGQNCGLLFCPDQSRVIAFTRYISHF